MPRRLYKTDHRTGEHNVEILGLDVHNPVFFIAAVSVIAFIALTLIFPESASALLGAARSWVINTFDWLFVVSVNFVFLFCLFVMISPLGRLRIGGRDARPEFSTKSWLAMLFSAGIGIGLMFWGAAEPLAYFTNWFGTPLNAESGSEEARRLALSATMFHWGINAWSIYAVIGLALAYFTFSKGLPLTIRSAFYPLLGERIWGWPGHVIDILAVIATLFGLATSLGLGAQQVASGLHYLFGLDASVYLQIGIIAFITSIAIVSVVRGLDGGVKVLSNINMVMAGLFLLFVFAVGPTLMIATGFFENTLNYARDFLPLSNWIGREDTEWFHGWTIFYWAWWISWSPFVGMFIARVSKGRTVREFLFAVIFVPLIITVIWFTTFGEVALLQNENGVGQLANGVDEVSLVLFHLLESLPLASIMSFVAIILVLVFFVTSSDSGSLVVDSITAGGKLHAPIPQRIFWATIEGLVAAVLLYGGGAQALQALQAGTVAAGLPFTIVLIVCCFSLWKGLSSDSKALRAIEAGERRAAQAV
ncbi:BCCT family transporter [Hyphobacterium sp. HN65]|uniref:BCCT family transporter n=1 Tax=Hyphobacterium lacteum TaxID=3116575 RepID=A0ABU7LM29_9PROT|nr:BCCT family transporter [Hyphobacterium sp. HN65]MEE2524959.1 BCCT family transporter [Hyphobacterium sp. HN65]